MEEDAGITEKAGRGWRFWVVVVGGKKSWGQNGGKRADPRTNAPGKTGSEPCSGNRKEEQVRWGGHFLTVVNSQTKIPKKGKGEKVSQTEEGHI